MLETLHSPTWIRSPTYFSIYVFGQASGAWINLLLSTRVSSIHHISRQIKKRFNATKLCYLLSWRLRSMTHWSLHRLPRDSKWFLSDIFSKHKKRHFSSYTEEQHCCSLNHNWMSKERYVNTLGQTKPLSVTNKLWVSKGLRQGKISII